MTRRKRAEDELLKSYRIALNNVRGQEEISKTMTELGYDDALIAEGRNLLEETSKKYVTNRNEDAETNKAYDKVEALREKLAKIYRLDRKKVKVIFRNEPAILQEMGIDGPEPRTVTRWQTLVGDLYSKLAEKEELQKKVARLKISPDHINKVMDLMKELDAAETIYYKEKGESQAATDQKNAAFRYLDDWMSEFYAVARIALDDDPQLLEALRKQVKSN